MSAESKIDRLQRDVRALREELQRAVRELRDEFQKELSAQSLGITKVVADLEAKIHHTGEDLGGQIKEVVNRVTAAEVAAAALAEAFTELHEEVFGNGGDGLSTPEDVFDLEIYGEEQHG